MKVLGINISHHSSSCLLDDGKIVYFLEDERLTRVKENSPADHHRKSLCDGTFEPCFIEKLKSYTDHVDLIVFASYGRVEADGSPYADNYIIDLYLKSFEKHGITHDEHVFNPHEHHVYHAAAGFYSSGFDDAVCLVLDGGGATFKDPATGNVCSFVRELESIFEMHIVERKPEMLEKIYGLSADKIRDVIGGESQIDFLYAPFNNRKIKITSSFSCGPLFNMVSTKTGLDNKFNFASPGKVMGLSQYYEDREEKYPFEEDDWYVKVKGVEVTNKKAVSKVGWDNNNHFSLFEEGISNRSANLAHKLQVETLKHTNYLIKRALSLSKSRNLVISGGYALNCLNNYQYLDELPEDVKVFIDPLSNDSGTALGAAKLYWYLLSGSTEKYPLTDLYLG